MNIVVTQVKSNDEAHLLAKYARSLKAKTKIYNDKEWEDYLLGLMIEESELEGGEVSRKEISQIFRRNGVDF